MRLMAIPEVFTFDCRKTELLRSETIQGKRLKASVARKKRSVTVKVTMYYGMLFPDTIYSIFCRGDE